MLRTKVPDNPFEVRPAGGRKILFYQNREVFLGGIHVDTEPLTGDFNAMMQVMATRQNNFFRHWVTAYYVYYTTAGKQNSCPFKFSGGRWDLRLYNDDYFRRLKAMLTAARRAGIVVQLTLFDTSGLSHDTNTELRWTVNPWHSTNNVNGLLRDAENGLPSFYDRRYTALADLQDAYVRKVVMETREFSNVVYEIMNEPSEAEIDVRVKWANAILNVMAPLLQGRRLVFYNDHSGNANDPKARGKDMNYWRGVIPPAQSSYSSVDGVILHGDPNLIDPAQTDSYGWTWGREKVLQLSTDAFPGPRDEYVFNRETASTVFGRQEMYQAESTDVHAAEGIRDANPKPTPIRLLPFMGCWDKTSTGGPHFNVRFDNNNRFVAVDPINDRILTQGRIVGFTDTTFSVIPDGQTTQNDFTYTLSPDGKTLTYTTSAQFTQTFSRIPFDFESLLFGWEKIGESTVSNRPRFFLYFKKNGANVSFSVRDPNNQQNIWDQGPITEVRYYPPQIAVNSPTTGINTYSYEFSNNGQNLALINAVNNRRQDFKRII